VRRRTAAAWEAEEMHVDEFQEKMKSCRQMVSVPPDTGHGDRIMSRPQIYS
jgi:hypothetical protein